MEEIEQEALLGALAACENNVTQAAKVLSIGNVPSIANALTHCTMAKAEQYNSPA
jgi:Bacterial regulatory protein, Fis family